MFIGHYAIAYAARRPGYLPSLAILFTAVQLLDLLWPVFVLLGIETFEIEEGNTALTPLKFTSYPYSHSLFFSFIWGVLFAVIYYAFTKNRRGSLLLVPLVVSHWVLDYITHKPDLPLSPFSDAKLGLGLWNSPVVEIILETSLFVMAVLLYFWRNKPKRRIAFWSLAIIFLIIYFMNIGGPPPPSINAVAWSANLMWLFVIWAWWIERPINGDKKASEDNNKNR
jgi:membrane-bound metal-dependent hydrolase YbcI (DUF457 family)